MCGRFGLVAPAETVQQQFQLPSLPSPWDPRYNISPGQAIWAVVQDPTSSKRHLKPLQWGLIPIWAKEIKPLINARAETLTVKPSFRSALRQRRCLIPADGFYEWQGRGKAKQPFHIGLQDGSLFALAGLWEGWISPQGEQIESCAVITVPPNPLVAAIHDRMPAILDPGDYALWLDPTVQDPSRVLPLLKTYPAESMVTLAVGNRVNSPKHDDASCREPLPASQGDLFSHPVPNPA